MLETQLCDRVIAISPLRVLKFILNDFCIVCTTFHAINFTMVFSQAPRDVCKPERLTLSVAGLQFYFCYKEYFGTPNPTTKPVKKASGSKKRVD
jgi:hypothetical protein